MPVTALTPHSPAELHGTPVILTTAWIQSAQSNLAQMECPQSFGIAEISFQSTCNTGTWCYKWHEDCPKKDWDTVKVHMFGGLQVGLMLAK
ncbi:hypothetical protein DSO57_1007382 [Entomophthora muscae]|uniref:Uncharacterized protein n=1 Tax=Entomophthora muscae TaxID=34485 RepID=A0ACC2TV21_9FUNG|nr:hypothetical protein DSO57_1007382 [Entomophthora muscae]